MHLSYFAEFVCCEALDSNIFLVLFFRYILVCCNCLYSCLMYCACACVCVSVVSIIVKCPVLPPSVVDGRSRNPLYYYNFYYYYVLSLAVFVIRDRFVKKPTCA